MTSNRNPEHQTILERLLTGEESPDSVAAQRAFAADPSLQSEFEELTAFAVELDEIIEVPPAVTDPLNASIREQVQREFSARQRAPRRIQAWPWLWLAAAAVILAALGLMIPPADREEPGVGNKQLGSSGIVCELETRGKQDRNTLQLQWSIEAARPDLSGALTLELEAPDLRRTFLLAWSDRAWKPSPELRSELPETFEWSIIVSIGGDVKRIGPAHVTVTN